MMRMWLWPGLAMVLVAAYVGASAATGYAGFPLDDAWIHQTYARSLGERGEYAFVAGQKSAGSTAPGWTALLAMGYALRVDYRWWTYGLGVALLAANAWLAFTLTRRLWPQAPGAAWAAGLLVAGEWHLVWAAASGMETLLFSALVLLAFAIDPRRSSLLAGLAAGATVLARPDGVLVLPFVAAPVLGEPDRKAALRTLAGLLAGFALVFGPYLLFNDWVSGSAWPNTLYAKQAEYASLRAQPLALRLAAVGAQPFIGPALLLLPGLAAALWQGVRGRHWDRLALLGWAAATIAAYAWRLPVIYQHGRYIMPVVPALVVAGVGGLAQIMHLRSARPAARIASRAWAAALAGVAGSFLVLGARGYASDVRVIETEMVAAARWVAAHAEPEAMVAAHDIGALGYFGERRLLDMAGLISPEVIPFIRDEQRLAAWLDASGADYLVTFPGWYPELVRTRAGEQVYSTAAPYSPAAGYENMAVYRWPATEGAAQGAARTGEALAGGGRRNSERLAGRLHPCQERLPKGAPLAVVRLRSVSASAILAAEST